jgi:hypothetical protein
MLTLLLFTVLVHNTPDGLEQKACIYFFESLFKENYDGYKVIEFENRTDTSRYWGVVYQCDNWDEKTKGNIVSTKPSNSVYVQANNTVVSTKKIQKNSRRLKMFVYSKIKVDDHYYVSIAVYKKFHFVDYYFIRFDSTGEIIDSCKTGEVI